MPKVWKLYLVISIFLIAVLVGLFLSKRIRPIESQGDLARFPIRSGWVIEIKSSAQIVTFEAGSPNYFYFQNLGSDEILAANPSEIPIHYDGDEYFSLNEDIPGLSSWVIRKASSAEGQIRTDSSVQVRTYPPGTLVIREIINSMFFGFFVWLFISLFAVMIIEL